jgi:hypothetical protein
MLDYSNQVLPRREPELIAREALFARSLGAVQKACWRGRTLAYVEDLGPAAAQVSR